MMETIAERFLRLFALVSAAEQRARAAEEYAERSARLHHDAICLLNQQITGRYGWPGKDPQADGPTP